jgi:hypothetical protein
MAAQSGVAISSAEPSEGGAPDLRIILARARELYLFAAPAGLCPTSP